MEAAIYTAHMATRKPPGHKRAFECLTPAEEVTHPRQQRMWAVSCKCGWRDPGPYAGLVAAQDAYRAHIQRAYDERVLSCRRCGEVKELPRRLVQQGHHICADCEKERQDDWRTKNQERYHRSQRNATLKKKYGITVDDYERMLAEQDGCCAICPSTALEESKFFHVDHCHATGRVRGLLCNACNRGLGQFADDPDRLRTAAAYIERYQ
ncbi:endonuclease VII domain-containing protein [Streptomyces sp. cg35]|uniref:endonuclease VII domain-containing protein n=1 Tax=Streptomyces sp. cg35 TaxID=3421650 RepID=UPI003D170EC1